MHCGILKNKDQIVSLKVKEVATNNAIPILGSKHEKMATLEWLQNKKVWSRGALGSHNQDLNVSLAFIFDGGNHNGQKYFRVLMIASLQASKQLIIYCLDQRRR